MASIFSARPCHLEAPENATKERKPHCYALVFFTKSTFSDVFRKRDGCSFFSPVLSFFAFFYFSQKLRNPHFLYLFFDPSSGTFLESINQIYYEYKSFKRERFFYPSVFACKSNWSNRMFTQKGSPEVNLSKMKKKILWSDSIREIHGFVRGWSHWIFCRRKGRNKNKFPICVDPSLSSHKKGDLKADFVNF